MERVEKIGDKEKRGRGSIQRGVRVERERERGKRKTKIEREKRK